MNIIVYTHSMEIGGSQLNAIQIAGAIKALGHNVLLVGEDGELSATAKSVGLEHIVVSEHRRRPSVTVMMLLNKLVLERDIDLIHGYEWPPVLDAWFGPHLRFGTPVVATVMSMSVAPFLPRSVSLTVGTENIRRQSIQDGFLQVDLIEPPVDVNENSPAYESKSFRARYGFDADTLLVVVVSRLARELKLEGLRTACRVIGDLAKAGEKIGLAIVGDGPVRAEIKAEADRANALNDATNIVVLTGELRDPRPAYAGADIALGMGGSALRAMAFGKPLVVQGEEGFWKLLDEESVSYFLESGWYGQGDAENGEDALRAALRTLIGSPGKRRQLGEFGRKLVVERFSLEHAAKAQLRVYHSAVVNKRRSQFSEFLQTLFGVIRHKLRRRWGRFLGKTPADDFNALSKKPT